MADPCVPRQALVGEEDLGAQRTREGAGWLPLAVLQLGVHVQLALGPELLGTNSARMVWSFVDELVLLQVPPGLELFVTDCTVSWVLVAAPDVLSKLSSRSDGLGALVALEARLLAARPVLVVRGWAPGRLPQHRPRGVRCLRLGPGYAATQAF